MEAWNADVKAQMQQALADAQAPEGLINWGVWILKQVVTVDFALVIVALVVGLIVAVGATEFSKRFEKLFSGPNWDLRAQLYSAIWGAVTTTLLIFALTRYPVWGKIIATICVAPLAAFYSHRAYDALRRLFPAFMARASRRLRSDRGADGT